MTTEEQIAKAAEALSYKNALPLPKNESDNHPVIYIFRHGESEDNKGFLFSGWRDSPLTKAGVKQAEVLAEKLKEKKIQMLISSPQKRAIDTMKIAISLNPYAKNLPIITDKRLRERSYGVLQGQSKLKMMLEDPETLREYRRSYTKKAENGESLEMVVKRVVDFCNEIVPMTREKKVNVAISCHGNSMRGFRKYFEDLSNEQVCATETPLGQDYASYVVK